MIAVVFAMCAIFLIMTALIAWANYSHWKSQCTVTTLAETVRLQQEAIDSLNQTVLAHESALGTMLERGAVVLNVVNE